MTLQQHRPLIEETHSAALALASRVRSFLEQELLPSVAPNPVAALERFASLLKPFAADFEKVFQGLHSLLEHAKAEEASPPVPPQPTVEYIESAADPEMREILMYVQGWFEKMLPRLNDQHHQEAVATLSRIKHALESHKDVVDHGPIYHHDETPPSERMVPRYPDSGKHEA